MPDKKVIDGHAFLLWNRAEMYAEAGMLEMSLVDYESYQAIRPSDKDSVVAIRRTKRLLRESKQQEKPLQQQNVATDIDGVWRLIRSKEGGKWVDKREAKILVFRWNGQQLITKDAKSFSQRAFKIDSTASPTRILFDDLENTTEKIGPSNGIYKVNGNRLVLAISNDKENRTTTFPSGFSDDKATWLYEYERLN